MAAPARGSEETLLADNTSVAATSEVSFTWDTSSAYFGRLSVGVTFGSTGGNIEIYQSITERASPASGDYPDRAESTLVGLIGFTASAQKDLTFDVIQGVSTIRIYNAGAASATLGYVRGRKYT